MSAWETGADKMPGGTVNDPHVFIAIDKNTKQIYWTDKSPGVNVLHGQWSSPAYGVFNNVPQAIFGGGDGWVYSFDGRYTEAIDECLKAISVDAAFGNPYNDIGSYLIAQGDLWTCVRWFRRALAAPRYEARAYPHFNLGRVYEQRNRLLDAARHYGHALEERPDFAQAAKALRRVQTRLN